MLDITDAAKAKKKRSRPGRLPPREVGLNFIVQHQTTIVHGVKRHWPRLHFHEQVEGDTRLTTFDVLDDYFHDHPRYKDQSRLNTARALGLFADFSGAKLQTMSQKELSAPDEVMERQLLRGFAIALVDGTIDVKEPYKTDPLGLGWRPRGHKRARTYLSALTNVLAWMAQREETSRWQWISKSATSSKLGAAGALRVASELAIRKRHSLLQHLKGNERVPLWYDFAEGIIAPEKAKTLAVHSFSSKWAAPFLFDCFDLEDEAQMTAATMAAVLFASGFRMSEPLHTFTSDVQVVDGMIHLFAQHPAGGVVQNSRGEKVTRAAYLREFGLNPRDSVPGRFHAGWKGMANDDVLTQAYWLPIPALRRRVQALLMRYLTVTRPQIMARRPPSAFNHPFLFVSARDGAGTVGDPYTMSAFRSAWNAAVRRLSRLLDDPLIKPKKDLGTTPHGARHHYGRFLKLIEVPSEIITKTMNHRDPSSQEQYGRPSASEVNDLLLRRAAGVDAEPELRASFLNDYDSFNRMNAARKLETVE